MKKKICALILSVSMLSAGISVNAFAAETEDLSSDFNYEESETVSTPEESTDVTDSENTDVQMETDDSENVSDTTTLSDDSEEIIADTDLSSSEAFPQNSEYDEYEFSAVESVSRLPVIYNVSDSFVSGLEKPLKFYPNKFYDFKVTGAGMTNTNPVAGDIRWYPLYWSTRQVPTQMQQNTTWKIGSAKGITKAKTYNLYIFFKKQIYDGKKWTDPNPEMEEIEYITTTFHTAAIAKTVKTKSISGLKKKVTVSKGKTLKLKPVLSPKNSTEKVSYSSSNPKVATVSSKGVIKGIKAGTAKVTVKSGSKKVVVTVTVPKTATKKISGIKATLTIKKGKTSKLTPKLSPSNSDDKISYSSSNKKVATVSPKGIITAKKKGKTTITVKSGKKTVRCKVTVK